MSNLPQIEVEFSRVAPDGIRVLIGHEKGLAAREALSIDKFDEFDGQAVVSIPSYLKTITPSFIQGLFAKSVHKLGEKAFFEHYKFVTNAGIMSDIKAGIDRALTSRHLSGV